MRLVLLLAALFLLSPVVNAAELDGAWQHVREDGTVGTWIVSGEHFSIAWYQTDPATFVSTNGGSWSKADGGVSLTWEFDTATPDNVGASRVVKVDVSESTMIADGVTWSRLDDGKPGALEGAWLMTGRKRDGAISRSEPGARRTMKILSGTRFQWIAYNVETKEFSGSGGGTYTTEDGKYVESIEFFSRDNTRAGQSLGFTFEISDGDWHHIGKSSKGEPMHELWNKRKHLGI